MPEIDSQGPEYERKLTGIEQLVTDGALDILKDFCERRPELAESGRTQIYKKQEHYV